MAWAIVAIPRADDPVWKYSSEKVPHMTLLFLGDQTAGVDPVPIAQYISHVAKTSMRPFGMMVDRRDTLGDENADVLFFDDDRYDGALCNEVRSYLLANPEILKLYNSIEQFPVWIPHLTMGFPATPAKKDDREHTGFHYVEFDRIAFWTGDYSGYEYRLQGDQYGESGLVMSDQLENFLEHFGVRGMKWGVRRDRNPVEVSTSHTPGRKVAAKGGENQPAHEDAVRTAAFKQKAKASTTDALSNKELKDLVTRMNLEQQYSQLSSNRKSSLTAGTAKVKQILDTKQTFDRAMNDPAVKPFVNKLAADFVSATRKK